jgi:DNA-binding NtrC family response regulator
MERGLLNKNKKSILLVDDDETVLKTLEKYLNLRGYTVGTAKTGKEAIQKSQRCPFNLAILDVNLPDMSGAEVLVAIDKAEPQMKKIMLTGYPDLVNGNEAINKRADACLIKPVEPARLSELIEQKLAEQTQELAASRKQLLKAANDKNKLKNMNRRILDKLSQFITFRIG